MVCSGWKAVLGSSAAGHPLGRPGLGWLPVTSTRPGKPSPDPPSGELRPNEPISYRVLVEHLGFNTKSRTGVMMLRGRVLQVYGPVWQIERRDSGGAVLCLGTGRATGSVRCLDNIPDLEKVHNS